MSSFSKRIVIGSDHVGYDLKENIKAYLDDLGIACQDVGAFSSEPSDYPVYAGLAVRSILSGEAERGILVCGTGIGMSIAANKFPGIRAAACSEPYSAALARQHNDANVLAFGARVVGAGLARSIVEAWLKAVFEGGRHANRLKMIARIETENQQQDVTP